MLGSLPASATVLFQHFCASLKFLFPLEPFVYLFYLDSKATVAMCNLWHYWSTVLAQIWLVVTVVRINISLGSHGVCTLSLQVPVLCSEDNFVAYKAPR